MAFLMRRLARAPGAHLYHYAPYEKTALRRLASMHATAEEAVDELLRENRMVDLYRVVREAVRVGEASYSIKSLERFYMPARDDAGCLRGRQPGHLRPLPRDGRGLVARRHSRLQPGRLPLDAPAARLAHRPRQGGRPLAARRRALSQTSRLRRRRRSASNVSSARRGSATQAALEAALVADPKAPMPRHGSSWPTSSAFTAARRSRLGGPSSTGRSASADELQDDDECLGGCVADGEDWIGQEKRSLTFRYHYPEQETKLREGSAVHLAATGEAAGTILSLDEAARIVVLKRGKAKGELPREVSLIPGGPLNTDALRDAVWAVAADMVKDGDGVPAHHRTPAPRSAAAAGPSTWRADRPSLRTGTIRRGCSTAAISAVHALDRSWLVIQGPPGAGKTYTTSHLILSLIRAGKTVGVASNSHKAIDNVLHAVEERLAEAGEPIRLLGQKKDGERRGLRPGRASSPGSRTTARSIRRFRSLAGQPGSSPVRSFAPRAMCCSWTRPARSRSATSSRWPPRQGRSSSWATRCSSPSRSRVRTPATAAVRRSTTCSRATPSCRRNAASFSPRPGACTRTSAPSSPPPSTTASSSPRPAAPRSASCSGQTHTRR